MAISRIAIKNPAGNTPSIALTSTGTYVLSVIIANVSENQTTKVDVWISPSGTSNTSEWGYIIKNAAVDPGNSLETFRFALVPDDVLYVKSDNGLASFNVVGIAQ